jgi:hypothetical protein
MEKIKPIPLRILSDKWHSNFYTDKICWFNLQEKYNTPQGVFTGLQFLIYNKTRLEHETNLEHSIYIRELNQMGALYLKPLDLFFKATERGLRELVVVDSEKFVYIQETAKP